MMKSRYVYDEYDNEVLINKEHILDSIELEKFEAIHSYRRLTELALSEVRNKKFDSKHLKEIHNYIFQDVYCNKYELRKAGFKDKLPLRGEFRVENIAKGNFQFANAMYIENELKYLLEELKNENHLKGLSLVPFIKRISYYLAELNVIHPFREGNGRSIREFIRQLSMNAGYVINWSLLDGRKDVFMEAMILSVSNTSKLEALLLVITKKCV